MVSATVALEIREDRLLDVVDVTVHEDIPHRADVSPTVHQEENVFSEGGAVRLESPEGRTSDTVCPPDEGVSEQEGSFVNQSPRKERVVLAQRVFHQVALQSQQ